MFCRAHRSTNPPTADECDECQARIRQEAEDQARAARLAADAARQAEQERVRRETEARIAQQQQQTRRAGIRALALNGVPFVILLGAATVGIAGSKPGLAAALMIASGFLAGRTVTRLIVVIRKQAPWKINLDAAFGWQSIWATIIVFAAAGYLAWSQL